MSLVDAILVDVGMGDRAGEEGIEETVWEMMQQESPFQKKGRLTNANRFIATVREGARQNRYFHMKRYAYLRLSLEMDFWRGDKLNQLRLGDNGAGSSNMAGEGDKAPTGRMSAEEQALRASCANAMSVAAMLFSDEENQERQACVSGMMRFWDEWHSTQSKALRNTRDASEWALLQVSGGGGGPADGVRHMGLVAVDRGLGRVRHSWRQAVGGRLERPIGVAGHDIQAGQLVLVVRHLDIAYVWVAIAAMLVDVEGLARL